MKITNQTTKNAIKAQIMMANFTMAEVVDALSMEYGWSDSLSNFSAKLGRGSLRYVEALQLADVMGYDIVWHKRGRMANSSESAYAGSYGHRPCESLKRRDA